MQNPTPSQPQSPLPASTLEVKNTTKQNNVSEPLSTREIYVTALDKKMSMEICWYHLSNFCLFLP